MNRILTLIVIILLAGVAVLQIMSLSGRFPKTAFTPVCPVDAISMQDGKAVIDANKCIGCKRCVVGIPVPIREVAAPSSQPTGSLNSPMPTNSIPTPVAPAVQKPPAAATDPTKAIPSPKTKPTPNELNAKAQPPALVASYKVDAAKCIGCTLCVQYCPVQAISMVDGKALIDPAKCINCGICKNGNGDDYTGCPVSAIKGP